jgi:2-polyprenyl-6-methoxyphenol hydroxylase-like FAD-dependent oxidoreductase
MNGHARANLAPQFAEAVERARLDFFQPIVDLEAPRLVTGRVVLIGDAGSVARPHTAMGVPKAVADALALLEALERPEPLEASLAGFERARLRAHRAVVGHGRELGAYLESLLGPPAERRRRERERDPRAVLEETAAPIDYRLLERDDRG